MRILILLLSLTGSQLIRAQIGGIAAYEFLNLPNSAAVAALGGHHMALRGDDLTLAARNPSLLSEELDGHLALSHAFLPDGISNSYLAYGHHYAPLATTFQAGLQYAGYGGNLTRRDVTGQAQGTFSASDFALTVGAARQVEERLTVGVNMKVIRSQLAGYNSLGLGFDAAVHYQDTSGRFGISLLARNFGRQVTHYAGAGREPMPFELQVGIVRELRYLPFRFSVMYRYLDRWNVLYDDPEAEDNFTILFAGEDEDTGAGAGAMFFDNLARHFVINGELLLGRRRNLRLRLGYNHGLRRELRLQDFRSGAGYSYGFAWRTRRLEFSFGRGSYHLAGGVNQVGLRYGLR